MPEKKVLQASPNAWLLDFGSGCRAAVGTRVLMHLIDNPQTIGVPCTPSYCSRVAFWQGQLLPVMDMAARLGASHQQDYPLLAVAGYREQSSEETHFGALLLAAPPLPVVVMDSAVCPLPERPGAWNELAISCFDYQGSPIPVLHLGHIFSDAAATLDERV